MLSSLQVRKALEWWRPLHKSTTLPNALLWAELKGLEVTFHETGRSYEYISVTKEGWDFEIQLKFSYGFIREILIHQSMQLKMEL
jgi:hypothetical protein|tara:strand:+ start:4971 stop:5225 length:255 start_codon:yes stop_codon:yes gene_type:complete